MIRKQATTKTSKILIQFLLLTLIFLLGISTVSADPGVIYVNNDTGDDSYDGQNPVFNGTSGPKISIKNATGTVTDNGIVNIANGHYSGVGNTGITIDRNMTINGESQTGTIINGSGTSQIFNILAGVKVTIQNLRITNGSADWGGAIYNKGNLTVKNCAFTNNTAVNDGGAIINDNAICTVINSTFTGNTASLFRGGAIANMGNINFLVRNCIFNHNQARLGGAIANAALYDVVVSNIRDSIFNNNTATYGGAIAIDCRNSGTNIVTGCTFISNTATSFGGFYYNYFGTSEINFNRIYGNTAPRGAAIYSGFGSVDATKNWWGSNLESEISNKLYGDVTYNPWLYMTINAAPTTINNGETSLITVSFNNLFDGTTVTPLDPATGHIPDGTPVTFTTDLGSIGCKTIDKETSCGIATATLTADELAGIAHITATTDAQTLNTEVTINAKSGLYLTVTPNKTNPVVGDTVMYTLKVGNKGPDTATNVVMTYVVPEGLEFAGANVDVGTYTYDPVTRTITWTIGNVPVGDPYMWLSLKILRAGSYLINPRLLTSTYDPTLNTDTQSITIHATSNSTNNTANAASSVSMQNTGVPIFGLILAFLMVLGGFAGTRRK